MTENAIQTVLNYPPISRVRRNHGLEHATLHILSQHSPKRPLAGHSDTRGFWVLGNVPTDEVQEAVAEAIRRMNAGEQNLAVHPNCGTNFVTSGICSTFRRRAQLPGPPGAPADGSSAGNAGAGRLTTIGAAASGAGNHFGPARFSQGGQGHSQQARADARPSCPDGGLRLSEVPHVVYVLHGEDEFSMAQEIGKLEAKVGDAATASLNTTRLDGRTLSFAELENAARAMPFLAERRVVVLYHPLAKMEKDPALQERFKALLDQVPESTALLLVEYTNLSDRKKKPHWLLEWAGQAGERAFVRSYLTPKGPRLQQWIQTQAKQAGGQFSPSAAAMLAGLVGEDTRLAHQEIQKLVAYANYSRAVEPEDVDAVTALSGQVNIFMLVDALGMGDGRKAMSALHQLLDAQDVQSIFGMIVRQFRLILLAKEVLEQGGTDSSAASALKLHPFVADKITAQARRFSLETLEAIYRRLLEIDKAIKTGQIEVDVALDSFVAGITAPALR
jgi:DNA polymerase-3 subunit delta